MEKNETTTNVTTTETSKETKEKVITKKKNNLQVLVYNENIVFKKRFSSSLSAMVTPWKKLEDGTYNSGVVVPYNRLFRVTKLYEENELCKYTVEDGVIHFDCVSKFDSQFFPKDAKSGWIHFLPKIIEENNKKIISVDDRMVIEEIEPVVTELNQPTKIDFQTKNLKAFPIFFVKGFGLAVVEKEKAVLYITIKDFSRLYCGVTNREDLNNLIHNITPVFPIFSITISDKKSVVFLKLEGLKQFLSTQKFNSGLLRFEYSFKDPTKLHTAIIGKCED